MNSTTFERSFEVTVYDQGEDVGGTVDFTITNEQLETPIPIGGSTARPIEGAAESMPYAVEFRPSSSQLQALWDASGVPQIVGRVVEVELTEGGSPSTADVRRVGTVRATEPPVVQLHLVDEAAFDRVTLFGLNPRITIEVQLGTEGALRDATWSDIGVVIPTTSTVADTSGDFRRISSARPSRLPQFKAVAQDIIDSPSGSNTSGNFATARCETTGPTLRPITSFGALSASTRDAILNADAWEDANEADAYREIPNCWIYWPGGPTSGEVDVRFVFADPGPPTTPDLPYLVEEAGIRDLLTAIMDGTYGGGAMRFSLPPTSALPNNLLGGTIRLAIPGPVVRRDLLLAIARVAGLVMWIDDMGRISPRPWPVPPKSNFTQMELDALYHFDRTTATDTPTYEVKHSSAFNVWRAEGLTLESISPLAARAQDPATPFRAHALFAATIEEDDTGSSPISSDRTVHGAGMAELLITSGLVGSGSVAESFLGATLGGLAEGRIRGHVTSDAPQPGDLVIIDHDELKGLNPDTRDRSGTQLARVADRRKGYQGDEVSYEYRLIYGGEA